MGRAPTNAVLVSAAVLALAACSSGGGSSSGPLAPAPVISSVGPGSGPAAGGTAVVISGANFRFGTIVAFGGTAAAVVSVTPTTIAAVTPPHAGGAVAVTVTEPDFQTASLPGGFTYVGLAPVLTSVSPGSGLVAGGTPVTLSGLGFQPGATVTIGGASATIGSLTATSIAIATPPHTAGAVDVTVTNPDALSATIANGFTYTTTAPTSRVVTLSWNANREKGVNQAGGGYRVAIAGQAPITVPWVTGPLAPTTADVTLATGSYTVTVTAFAALDAQGGNTGSTSAPSQSINVVVP